MGKVPNKRELGKCQRHFNIIHTFSYDKPAQYPGKGKRLHSPIDQMCIECDMSLKCLLGVDH